MMGAQKFKPFPTFTIARKFRANAQGICKKGYRLIAAALLFYL